MPVQTTIKDIAQALGISVATVSRALRDTYDVSETTRERVLKKAEELNYKPNVYAVGLAGGKSKNIGIILPAINHYYFSTVITGIQETAYREGYNIILFVTNDAAERETAIIRNLNPLHLDGILIAASSADDAVPVFEMLLQNIPVVFFDRVLPDIATSHVRQDDYNGAVAATEHLLAQGYRRIAHLAGPPDLDFTLRRKQGYLDTLAKSGHPVREEWMVHSGFSQQDGFSDMERLLALADPPDAVFAVNDRKAIGAMLALKAHGIAIGPEIGVIGFTGDPSGEIISPSLTTVAEPAYDIGKQACELLISHITRSTFQPREVVLPGKLLIRDSTRRCL
ncbi:LacI family DNA-binding transcriptional regulator [Parapedobacter lycopersici]|uniref:LacI family DNA-binding transcriptional regulator n=1 Tax=Parapedobacter lycopersici TaxID=1864939 RepID=UPI00214D4513|nr:LacI family DNA-binding transcriptional regulator [Parapedobacter lycopersici]